MTDSQRKIDQFFHCKELKIKPSDSNESEHSSDQDELEHGSDSESETDEWPFNL